MEVPNHWVYGGFDWYMKGIVLTRSGQLAAQGPHEAQPSQIVAAKAF